MRNNTLADNIYNVGSKTTAKANPNTNLVIMNYYQRIYYCAVVDKPDEKHLAYFERELALPAALDLK
jgi:hypothetical protein